MNHKRATNPLITLAIAAQMAIGINGIGKSLDRSHVSLKRQQYFFTKGSAELLNIPSNHRLNLRRVADNHCTSTAGKGTQSGIRHRLSSLIYNQQAEQGYSPTNLNILKHATNRRKCGRNHWGKQTECLKKRRGHLPSVGLRELYQLLFARIGAFVFSSPVCS